MKHINFLKKALTDYRVGALTISSRFVVNEVLRNIGPEFKHIVEYGPGDGVVVKAILKKLPPDGKLAVIELNKKFYEELLKINDSRLAVINGSIIDLSKDLMKNTGLPKIDAVVSSVPFTYFKPSEKEEVIRNTHREMVEGGVFIVYQYTPLVRPILRKLFKKVFTKLELRNFPPSFIMVAEK